MTFDLYPAIDLRNGNVVRLVQGDYALETKYSPHPAEVAADFAAQGATWIHVVDLDAARDGGGANLDSIAAICEAAPRSRIQTGGGVRTAAAALLRLEAGAARVVVGSAAVEHPELVSELASLHPDAVVVGLDVRGREVSTHGWTKGAGYDVVDMIVKFGDAGAAACVATQIDVDGLLTGPDVGLYRELLAATAMPIIASGGVGTLDDLVALRDVLHDGRGLAGVIAGKAIYEQRFTVAQGIDACSRLA